MFIESIIKENRYSCFSFKLKHRTVLNIVDAKILRKSTMPL